MKSSTNNEYNRVLSGPEDIIRINKSELGDASIETEAKNSNDNLLFKSLLSGSCAGVASCLLFHPFDVLRTKMQSLKVAKSNDYCTSKGSTRYLWYTIQRCFKYGGYRSFYTGLSLPLSAQALYKATIFTAHNFSKQYIFTSKDNGISATFMSGCLAGSLNGAMFVTPVEFVRNQLIAQQHSRLVALSSSSIQNSVKLMGPMDVIQTTLRTSPLGFFGLYRGVFVTILRDGLGCGCFFTANEYILNKHKHQNTTTSASIDIGTRLFAGSMAGVAFWAIALPFDTIKTQIQTGEMKSIQQCFSTLSIKQLYSGWQVAFGRGAPSAAVTIGVYDFCFSRI